MFLVYSTVEHGLSKSIKHQTGGPQVIKIVVKLEI